MTHKHKSTYDFSNPINIVELIEHPKGLWLIDGQHRYNAEKLKEKQHNIDHHVAVEYRTVKTWDELRNFYKIINKNYPAPELPESIDKDIYKCIIDYFETKYKSSFSNAKRPTDQIFKIILKKRLLL